MVDCCFCRWRRQKVAFNNVYNFWSATGTSTIFSVPPESLRGSADMVKWVKWFEANWCSSGGENAAVTTMSCVYFWCCKRLWHEKIGRNCKAVVHSSESKKKGKKYIYFLNSPSWEKGKFYFGHRRAPFRKRFRYHNLITWSARLFNRLWYLNLYLFLGLRLSYAPPKTISVNRRFPYATLSHRTSSN